MWDSLFHPVVSNWFRERFGQATDAQELGWPSIARRQHTLIAAPTGSGKTLAAFLVCIDRLVREWETGKLHDFIHVVYISPLKALGNDIERNLRGPLSEIQARFASMGLVPEIRTVVRTGDTPSAERQGMLRRPPHILVTTPESLYLLLTAEKSRQLLGHVGTVIVDEIHALARDKRGSHLALSLARLDALCTQHPVRIGLSATQRPIDEIARFLVGSNQLDESGDGKCHIVDVGHVRELDLKLEVPSLPLEAVCAQEHWIEIYQRLTELIQAHRSTLIFVNTRRLAERVAHQLMALLGEDGVASHHGSLSRELRLSAEERLKAGSLKAIVATASLEMGIDIGYIDLVCQLGSPRSIASFLQRIGRSGHSLGAIPRGRLFPLTRDELLECLALIRAVRGRRLDRIEIPESPLDILMQQMIAAASAEEWDVGELYDVCRSAWPYRNLTRADFDAVVRMASDGIAPNVRRGRHLYRDAILGRIKGRRSARLAAITSGGAIPETAQYKVITEHEKVFVGQLDEDFAIESMAGDVFVLGNTSWQICRVRNGEVIVRDAQGAPPSIPFWFGEAPGRTQELSAEVSQLRHDLSNWVKENEAHEEDITPPDWLVTDCGATPWSAQQATNYVAVQQAAIGLVPTQQHIVFERFFDESGGMQLVIHSPWGARINRAWGLALRKRFCRSFDFELQASATDNGIVLSLGPQHSFPLESLFRMVHCANAQPLLEQAILAVPMFQVRWRWNVGRALIVLRSQGGRKVPPFLQRYQSDDLLSAVFPETVGCLENHSGDVEIPDHVLVRQTMHDCLHEAMDTTGWLQLLQAVQDGEIEFIARETREPSPFSHELIHANPYAFLDGAALEERRTRAVQTRRGLSTEQMRELGQLSPEAIQQVVSEAYPIVRDADELHDTLLSLVVATEAEGATWCDWMENLAAQGRAVRIERSELPPIWIAAESWPIVRAVWGDAHPSREIHLPAELDRTWDFHQGLVEIVRGRMLIAGPITASELSVTLGLRATQVEAALEGLEGDGTALRGKYRPTSHLPSPPVSHTNDVDGSSIEWCDRRLLARIHRMTLSELRRQIEPVSVEQYLKFLLRHQRVERDDELGGVVAIRQLIHQFQGLDLPAGTWESQLLESRVANYDRSWLDQLFANGEIVWGRLQPPRATTNRRIAAALTRNIPITIARRENLGWLLPSDRITDYDELPSNSQLIEQSLRQRGALFAQELRTLTQLLDGHLEEGLRQLSALGIVTSDSFNAVRQFVANHARRANDLLNSQGRWSLFPGMLVDHPESGAVLNHWCQQLLRRWGVLFRDLLVRDHAAPSWHALVPVLRTLERRGEIRGGRFIAGVAGEQFAFHDTVTELRRVRDHEPQDQLRIISGADPLNLVGIITNHARRVPSTTSNAVALRAGRYLATCISGNCQFFEPLEPIDRADVERSLKAGRPRIAS